MRWRLLLILPLVAFLIGPLYARHNPDFLGIAFFYWFELAATVVSIAITFLVFPGEQARPSRPLHSTRLGGEPRFSRNPSVRLRPHARARD
jgi:hypothetical protein